MATQQRDDAAAIVQEWQLLEPASSEARQFAAALTASPVAEAAPLLAGTQLRVDQPQDVRQAKAPQHVNNQGPARQPRG
jgi:hypothetical protein